MNISSNLYKKLQARIQVALLREWDPIGIQQDPDAQDEYDSYVSGVCGLLMRGAPVDEIFSYLWQIETVKMGLSGDRQKTAPFASRLIQIGEEVKKEASS